MREIVRYSPVLYPLIYLFSTNKQTNQLSSRNGRDGANRGELDATKIKHKIHASRADARCMPAESPGRHKRLTDLRERCYHSSAVNKDDVP